MTCRILILMCMVCLGAGPGHPGVTAEKWLGRLTIRPADSRTYVILFFDGEDSRELKEHVERLNNFTKRKDLLILGVTPERERVGQIFVRRYQPRFVVGIQSSSHRSYGVTRFPSVLVVKGEVRQQIDAWELMEELLGPEPEGSEAAPEGLTTQEIQARIDEQGYPSNELLDILRIRMAPDEFLQYCDELERNSVPGTWMGPLEYQRHLADPQTAIKQPPTTPAIDAVRKAQQKGTRKISEWEQLLKTRETWTHQEILDLYLRHWGDDPEDLVYRSDLPTAIGGTKNPQYAYPLLDMLEVEPDPGVRLKIINAISAVYDDDVSALPAPVTERLEAHLLVEDNIRWARSRLEGLLKDARPVAGESRTPP